MIGDLNTLTAFAAVADTGSFRAASERLGVTRSAVSQSVRRLEADLGHALFHRTTRSVRLTETGQAFLEQVGPALAGIATAAERTLDTPERPTGLLRLAVSSIAERFISGPMLAAFVARYPEVRLDILITDGVFDIVAEGFDAGVRLGEVIEQDMIAVPVSGPQRQQVVAAPAWLERHGAPGHPRDLTGLRCIGWRPAPGAAPYRWEFEEDGREFSVAVEPEITTNDMGLMIRLACEGAGLSFGMEETFRPWIARGDLVAVLEAYSPRFPGFFLYFHSRRHLAPRLRALIDHAREWREP